jgi:sulfur carrier protein
MNADSLTILLDGKPHAVVSGTTLQTLVAALGHGEQAVSTAINGDFVPRAQRVNTVLKTNDAVLLFQPIVGG